MICVGFIVVVVWMGLLFACLFVNYLGKLVVLAQFTGTVINLSTIFIILIKIQET